MANDLASQMSSVLYGNTWIIAKYTFIVFAFLLVCFAIWKYTNSKKKYPLKVIIFEKRGDDLFVNLSERLGKVNEDGLEKYKFKKSGDTLPPLSYEFIQKTANASGIATLYKYGSGQYKPIDVRGIIKDKNFEIIDIDDWNFKVIENRATVERRTGPKQFFEKWGGLIGLGIVSMIIIIVLYMSYGLIKDEAAMCIGAAKSSPGVAPQTPNTINLLKP